MSTVTKRQINGLVAIVEGQRPCVQVHDILVNVEQKANFRHYEMNIPHNNEARLLTAENVLIMLSDPANVQMVENFCGTLIGADDLANDKLTLRNKTVYLCGDISKASPFIRELDAANRVFVVTDMSECSGLADMSPNWTSISSGRLPLLVHGVGVLFPQYFDIEAGYFDRITAEHEFQSLTESNKGGISHRTGIYLTPVEESGEDLHFRLLRCSTNLSGPTENFGAIDKHIVDALNVEVDSLFDNCSCLNHVLAQIYHNRPAQTNQKQSKAKIKAHADKTKDMPANGVMAFCTFYDGLDKLARISGSAFDYGLNKTSGLTRLRFRLKPSLADDVQCTLPREFSVTLFPGSVFLMPLSTNRFYTHETKPSMLDAQCIPTRLGYVVRCSSREAVHKEGETWLKNADGLKKLALPSDEDMAELRTLYARENKTDDPIEYGDQLLFSMNKGDYAAPGYHQKDNFRCYSLPIEENMFESLSQSTSFDIMGKGRRCAVLVNCSGSGEIPLVRTTTKFDTPAQHFKGIHHSLVKNIKFCTSLPFELNNALVEIYTNDYAKMGFHSDQALDLANDSYIALYSCYRKPEATQALRKLVIQSKVPDGVSFDILLEHNSVVVFSVDANRRFKHKIVLDKSAQPPENEWLGVTFRTSKTLIEHKGSGMHFCDGTPLTLATEEQKNEILPLRGRENREREFTYPRITYTLSASDLHSPVTE